LGLAHGATPIPTPSAIPAAADAPAPGAAGKVGTNKRIAKAPSAVVDLDTSNFNAIVGDASKHKLVEFYAPWW